MKKIIKNLTVVALLSFVAVFGVSFAYATAINEEVTSQVEHENYDKITTDYCGDNSLTNGLENNQTTLFYMYSNDNGHWFLDPLASEDNIIYVSWDELEFDTEELHHGKQFVGTFADDALWELVGLEEVEYE